MQLELPIQFPKMLEGQNVETIQFVHYAHIIDKLFGVLNVGNFRSSSKGLINFQQFKLLDVSYQIENASIM